MKLTDAQRQALTMISKRDWPGGEPHVSWFNTATLRVLLHHELAEERFPGILHLTLAGRAALQEVQE